ncbi:uncharacterized protein [Malus domestica]|uniref:uncharacterized protein n=1 Tax=Malus domestica TaxID=3750 RepID=UPI003974DF80
MLTIRLHDDHFVKWSFQFRSVLEGYDLFDHFDGTLVCPLKFAFTEDNGITTEITAAYKEWIKRDRALVSLLLATLGDEAVEYVVGCKTVYEAWMNLQDKYSTVLIARVNHLKTKLLTIKKRSDSVEKYMLRLKALKDQLMVAGEVVYENDIIVASLAGLPTKFNMIRTPCIVKGNPLMLIPHTIKEFLSISLVPMVLSLKLIILLKVMLTDQLAALFLRLLYLSFINKGIGIFRTIEDIRIMEATLEGLTICPDTMGIIMADSLAIQMVSLEVQTTMVFLIVLKKAMKGSQWAMEKVYLLPILDKKELPRMVSVVLHGSSEQTREPSSLSPSQAQEPLQDTQAITLHQSHSSSQVLHVHALDQNQALSPVIHTSSGHNMVTRLKSGVLQKKDYSSYYAYASDNQDWRNAMKEEFEALHKQGTWELVPPPVNRNVIGSKWVYKIKKDQDGKVSRYKARLVAQGYSQEQGLDYEETLSPVSSHLDPSLFVKVFGTDVVILLLYVDDIIITGSSSQLIQQVVNDLGSVFNMKDMGKLTYFLGLQITYRENGDIFINQSKYVTDLLNKARMVNCRPCSTPSKPHTQLLKDEGEPRSDPTIYRILVGALQYLTFTRPDIAYAVNYACQFMTTPTKAHFCLIKRILRYLKVFHTRIKHLDTDFHFVRERVQKGDLQTRISQLRLRGSINRGNKWWGI